jgi:hypothetical protein
MCVMTTGQVWHVQVERADTASSSWCGRPIFFWIFFWDLILLRRSMLHVRMIPRISMPELLWKVYIDFEIEEGECDTARGLYEWLIALSGHVKVWTSYVLFEAEPIPIPRAEREEGEEEDEDEDTEPKAVPGDANLAKQVFERGYKDLKSRG